MFVRIVLIAMLLAAGVRFGRQGWNSDRDHRVGSGWSGRFVDRHAQPFLCRAAMALHTLLVAVFVGSAVVLAVELVSKPG